MEHFAKLTPECLKELCPHLATRLVLQEKLSEFITAQAPTETNSNTCTSNNTLHISLDDIEVTNLFESPKTVNIQTRKTFPQFDLETLLQTSPGGNSILKFYETYSCLDNSKRSQLTDIIIKHIYTYIVNCRITYEEYNVLAAKIITLFPKESIGTYFTKPIKKIDSINGRSTVARGKLVDKVRNLLYKYGDRKRSASESESTPPPKKSCDDLKDLHSRDILWLNNNSEPWEEVIIKWKATYNLRKEGEQKNIHEFLRDWKILSDPRSEILINIDFDLLYPEKGLNFYLNWDTFYEKFIGLKQTQDERIINLIDSLKNIEGELKLPTQLKILAKLLPPKGRLSKKIKFTTEEAIESLFICVPNAGDIEQTIINQREKALAKKLSIQPYIILQGSLSEGVSAPLLIIDDVKYQFQSITKSFDTLFKLYHTFNARYPKAGDHLYLIIQRCVYKIETKYDNVVCYIMDVLNL